jgi:NDP-sugar pyrophosphorylase family protein
VAGFQAQTIKSLVSNLPVQIHVIEDFQHGDAVAFAQFLQQANVREDVLVMNADLMTFEMDFLNLLKAYQMTNRCCVLFDALHPEEDRLSWPGVQLNSTLSQVQTVTGHVADSEFRLSGLYIFTTDNLEVLKQPSANNQPVYLFQRLQELEQPIQAVQSVEPLVHVDRTFDYLEANQVILRRAVNEISQAKGVYVYEAGRGEPNPEFVFPGTIIEPGSRIIFEENSFISPYQTRKAHLEAISKIKQFAVVPIRIRGHVHLREGAWIGLNALIEGNLVLGKNSSIEDSVVEKDVLAGERVIIRRHAVIRGRSVLGDDTRFECAADFEGVAGKGTIYMHPGQCWIVTGQRCDLGAGNFFGTWRFDSGRCAYQIDGRTIIPKSEEIANASYLGDDVRTAIGVSFYPGTRIGADALIGAGYVASGTIPGGYSYYIKQDKHKVRVGLVRPKK